VGSEILGYIGMWWVGSLVWLGPAYVLKWWLSDGGTRSYSATGWTAGGRRVDLTFFQQVLPSADDIAAGGFAFNCWIIGGPLSPFLYVIHQDLCTTPFGMASPHFAGWVFAMVLMVPVLLLTAWIYDGSDWIAITLRTLLGILVGASKIVLVTGIVVWIAVFAHAC
jgi:hypothetical protein